MYGINFNKNIDKFKGHYGFAGYPVTVYKYPDGSKKKIGGDWVYRCYYWEQVGLCDFIKIPKYKEIK